MQKPTIPTRSKHTTLKQLCQLIPGGLTGELAREHGVKSRSITPWSHVVSLLYAHLTHSLGLNDVCDGLRNNRQVLSTIRGACAPSRNGLSNANRSRPSAMAEDLFWKVLRHLESIQPGFGGHNYQGFPRRFKRTIQVVDSSTIALVANCIDWAKHRRRKAAAKLHLSLDLQSFLPQFAIVDTAGHSDVGRARELCAGLKEGEIVVFDKAYLDYIHLRELDERGVIWVTRAKTNIQVHCVKRRLKKPQGAIQTDEEVIISSKRSRARYTGRFRRITAWIEVDGRMELMSFITNHMQWAPGSICDLYKCRWGIEAFFKQIKRTLQLCDFLGHNRNAIQWQVWTGLLTYILLRFLAFLSNWPHSFTRIFTTVRGVLWRRVDLRELLQSYGIAGGGMRMHCAPNQAYLPGFTSG